MNNIILRREGVGTPTCDLIAAYSNRNIKVVNKDNERLPDDLNYVFRWATTSNLPRGVTVINKASSIHLVYNKPLMRQKLRRDWLCPITFVSLEELKNSWALIPMKHFPIIVRPCHHERGQEFHKVWTLPDAERVVEEMADPKAYFSIFIDIETEYRVVFCTGRVLWVCKNMNQDRDWHYIGWDNWPESVMKKAYEAYKLSGLDFGAVDVMVDTNGEAWVSEVNSGPEVVGNYQPRVVAKAFDFIIDTGKDHIPIDTLQNYNWREYLHPILDQRAMVR